ncbi:MAG TPA: bifunctional proline dehydrogenase/L-glutamate gamma-semialdehyde dehydrogenase PutA [Magnetospirillaceae bacterium]|jgi:RHH-type proline utilization regulon transcriptional repressor/proline dehydrogenase/delta 1-pyrroline-5-carboxylate dehydrogenase
MPDGPSPFEAFRAEIQPRTGLRAAIDDLHRKAEPDCVKALIEAAQLSTPIKAQAHALAADLITHLRTRPSGGLVQGLMHEYALSSQEGIALLCLAEALLRIPDTATRDALIADKVGGGEWHDHVGRSASPFVNAATWGLVVTGKLVGTVDEAGLGAALARLIARGGAPLIRAGVDIAMKLLGEQFVRGETIDEALQNARKLEVLGFRYSYDMLGEAAMTAADAARYFESYQNALHAIGTASAGRGIYEGPGLSIKLSALHPRYQRSQRARVMAELLPRVRELALLARRYDIGINIDAEESERLDLSLDILEALCADAALQGWNGIGFVVQAYQKRAYAVIAFVIDLARRTQRRIMLRLVKGAYWDSEIKRAQIEGQADFPVFTRKNHTDVSYIACARQLLDAPREVYPQFATHNALTLATIHAMAGPNFYAGQYEFQCLHGMGEPLYEQVVGAAHLNRPCRVYAPVGSHDTLLAYLVRRLLENGANTSFVNRVATASIPIKTLLEDPIEAAAANNPIGAPHAHIALPRDLFGTDRANSAGLDFNDDTALAEFVAGMDGAETAWPPDGTPSRNPADPSDIVGFVRLTDATEVAAAVAKAEAAWLAWRDQVPEQRATILERAAALLEEQAAQLSGLICREAGKTFPNAIGEIREAADFLRYYASPLRRGFANATHRPRGVIACISPWNFPISIFTGQIAAALAAGNAVVAKPAEETPLIAEAAVRLLHQAGIPQDVLVLVNGDGAIGAALVAQPGIAGVAFTGSIDAARSIQRSLAERLGPDGHPIPLIAETGGQNALIVDSSALTEQVVADTLASAFDSAGQRCSALRVLCLQDDIADRTLTMIRAAMDELAIGTPDRLSTDIGPIITREARDKLVAYVDAMRQRGFAVYGPSLPDDLGDGYFIAPTLIEIGSVGDLEREVFGPILHVVRYRRDQLPALIDQLNAMGYGLTGGIHSRVDSTIDLVCERLDVGNIYVNRNIIGAVVGVQPFGGHGLSGTGPKAGGPLYLKRFLSQVPADWPKLENTSLTVTGDFLGWIATSEYRHLSERCEWIAALSRLGTQSELKGPVGERNLYELQARGAVLCEAETAGSIILQIACALSTGNRALLDGPIAASVIRAAPLGLRTQIGVFESGLPVDAVLTDREGEQLTALLKTIAERTSGPIVTTFHVSATTDDRDLPLDWLLKEKSIAINTTAAGGNASLMSIG